MSEWIALSTLNDFVFCPYSIYLHNVYMDADEEQYHATPQVKGRHVHEAVDEQRASRSKDDLVAISVSSEQFKIYGCIDLYLSATRELVERKYKLTRIYQGQIYQLWGQYFCLREMGVPVERMAFAEVSTRRRIPIALPTVADERAFESFVDRFHKYDPMQPFTPNANKCRYCIYNNLCDKSEVNHVY